MLTKRTAYPLIQMQGQLAHRLGIRFRQRAMESEEADLPLVEDLRHADDGCRPGGRHGTGLERLAKDGPREVGSASVLLVVRRAQKPFLAPLRVRRRLRPWFGRSDPGASGAWL
jgi:hypothetical protein